MNLERWKQVDSLLQSVLERQPDEREAFLLQVCAGDKTLEREVRSLLTLERKAGSFLQTPVMEAAPPEMPGSLAGKTISHYRVLEKVGDGGMGTVWKARDTRLDRDVAIKVLHAAKLTDSERKRRFVLEARSASALNHPNIITIYDIDQVDGADFIAMEFVDGKALDRLIGKSGLALKDTLKYAIQVADALVAAHAAGIVHRDLKPANVMVNESGCVKVLDFGLAKLTEKGGGENAGSLTAESPGTEEGMLLGTASYMSPEQAEGKRVDARSDIFSFGAVLYEMITGRRAFPGDSMVSILSAVLRDDPQPAHEIVKGLPRDLDRIVTRCLSKDPSGRYQHAGDLRLDLEQARASLSGMPEGSTIAAAPRWRSTQMRWWMLAPAGAALLALIGFLAWRAWNQEAPPLESVHMLLSPPEGYTFNTAVISPDGSTVAATAMDKDRVSRLWVHSLTNLSEQVLPGTEGASGLFWSADSKEIGYFAGDQLKTISAAGGRSASLDNALRPGGGAWNAKGTILFCPDIVGPIVRVPARGGARQPVTRVAEDDFSGHSDPQFLSDGERFVFQAGDRRDGKARVFLGSLGSMNRRLLVTSATRPYAVAPDLLLFLRNGNLMAERVDFNSARLLGEALTVARPSTPTSGIRTYSVSSHGLLTYLEGPQADHGTMVWYGRDGSRLGAVEIPSSSVMRQHSQFEAEPFLSPDEKRVSLSFPRDGFRNAWLLQLDTGVVSPLTFETGQVLDPIWSPDGRRLAYQIYRQSGTKLMTLTLGEHDPKLLLEDGQFNFPDAWSPDGKWILGRKIVNPGTPQEMLSVILIPADASGPPKVLMETKHLMDQLAFSPDGKWVAYDSVESRQWEVYVARFPSMTDARQISSAGGCQPLWRGDGKELFYITRSGQMMAAPLTLGPSLATSAPKMLFQTNLDSVSCAANQYVVTRDGQKFFMQEPVGRGGSAGREPMYVVSNWQAALRN